MGVGLSPDAVNNYIASLFARLRPCFARSIDSLMLRASCRAPSRNCRRHSGPSGPLAAAHNRSAGMKTYAARLDDHVHWTCVSGQG